MHPTLVQDDNLARNRPGARRWGSYDSNLKGIMKRFKNLSFIWILMERTMRRRFAMPPQSVGGCSRTTRPRHRSC